MADDNLLNDDDLLGDDDNDLLGDEDNDLFDNNDLDDSLLDEDVPQKKPRLSDLAEPPPAISESKESVLTNVTASSSAEKLEQEVMNDPLDYEDDLEEVDEKERRESKFESERADSNKPKNIDELLPQQRGQRYTPNDVNNSDQFARGRGTYRGRSRGNYRGRGGFRPPHPGMYNAAPFFQNGVPFYPNPPFPIGGMPPGVMGNFAPNLPPNDQITWNKRVEAFMRQTTDSNAVTRSRSYSASSSGSSCSTCSSSDSQSRSRSTQRRGGNRRNDRLPPRGQNKPVDEKKAALECAEAIGLDAEYLKKVEEQKRLREEIQKKKAKKFQDDAPAETTKVQESRKRERSPERRRSPDRRNDRDRDRPHRRHHHHKKHHRSRDRASSIERIAEQALKAANAAINPLGTHQFPPGMTMAGMNGMLPPMNVPPPPLPGMNRPQMPPMGMNMGAMMPPRSTAPMVPTLRTVSTATVVSPMMPKIVTYEPPPDAKERKLKAHLVVVISNIGKLQNGLKRITLFASSVGDAKKVWQDDGNSVSIIFKKLEDAKKFLTQYHNQAISGVRLDVSLHKMYLNLDTMAK